MISLIEQKPFSLPKDHFHWFVQHCSQNANDETPGRLAIAKFYLSKDPAEELENFGVLSRIAAEQPFSDAAFHYADISLAAGMEVDHVLSAIEAHPAIDKPQASLLLLRHYSVEAMSETEKQGDSKLWKQAIIFATASLQHGRMKACHFSGLITNIMPTLSSNDERLGAYREYLQQLLSSVVAANETCSRAIEFACTREKRRKEGVDLPDCRQD